MFKKLTLEFWYQALFFAIVAWLLLVTNGCATTDQYGCTARQNRVATKHYYKAKAKCPGRIDLLYRTDNPIHDSSYTETVYLPGEPIVKVDTLTNSDTVQINGYFYITKLISRTIRVSQVDTSVKVQERVRTVTVTRPGENGIATTWVYVWAILATIGCGGLLFVRVRR